ncbi:aspartyl/glutamyl-tRNA amidotransferase subunit A [Candidatus Uhrbacteria bacterium RIFCSPLOWO2_01_FULL_47_24]|uniref:Glutamyl-tRNA(Gln) amidotransferase subunit A n=1 Tax=Candidatus Uhrbacteria bacterium RIFCSPLOWO2_01_FULL_47_24 TaxID=1802401 RepID=A0A1F7US08_9BACT|nr:MAG: aspartyl/glutamyl-tRNA amidotransferase subunit A [Candidatus Uhrbacteria bacterium RIFCSPHIGHO2_02_FULL_46_47]OGL76123.1 MAG: aspartyl/glutamyl-tRNA amidotransferase subunit A [Candidatus Uhrbacteria bacterium RIFCSPHIGHO2_12_FULL_47_11]OGL81082.1 MAG: aspartyl/glutamyl-tRNA amidotransferase subunit A [Candidatus Uhrbacteria bacterium RIFCSPLOWO2_01_FULL_47_24]OGL84601.1 MAG: aspartyl/glutamyl-tRNA amidotransferase subunit A [Candidatus Uhrbacteria bacterium RIFCSPLOWO2_02_FULL_46_25]O
MPKLNELTIAQAHEGLKKKEFSSQELTKACVDRIYEVDEKVNAFLTVTEKEALAQANVVDKKIKAGVVPGLLEGIPVAIKDVILVKGVKCTASSKILENYIATYDATVIKKLKQAGAVILGKTNNDEFAMGSSGENSAYKITRNPHDLDRVPGGSSAGSAASVAAHECIYSLGSDTGGSIRQPAALCGVVGLKPTYGSVSRYGLIAMSSGLDVIGPFTKSVEDARIVFEAIKGKDPMDATTVECPSPDLASARSPSPTRGEGESRQFPSPQGRGQGEGTLRGMRVGVPKEYFIDGMDNETEKTVRQGIAQLEKLGAEIIEISLPYSPYALAVYYVLQPAEASANLARFDGIRYGHSVLRPSPDLAFAQSPSPSGRGEGEGLYGVYAKSRAEGFGDEPKRRIMIGTYVLSAGYADAYYKKAQAVRTLVKRDFDDAFTKVDCIATPTSPTPAWLIGERMTDPLSMYLADIFTVSANIAGIPGISVPCGKAHGLPVGLQILAPQLGEDILFRVTGAYEMTVSHNS